MALVALWLVPASAAGLTPSLRLRGGVTATDIRLNGYNQAERPLDIYHHKNNNGDGSQRNEHDIPWFVRRDAHRLTARPLRDGACLLATHAQQRRHRNAWQRAGRCGTARRMEVERTRCDEASELRKPGGAVR